MSQGQLTPGRLPVQCYPSSPQTLYNLMFQLGVAQLPNLTGIVISDTQPGINDQDKAWVKTSGGAPLWPPVYTFFNGQWVARHQADPGGAERRWFAGTLAELITYDGGDALPAGQASGPMWEEDTDFQGRSPIHPGGIPSTTPPATINVNDNMGEGQHALVQTELPANINVTATLPGNRTNMEPGDPQWLAPTASGGIVATTPATETASFAFVNTNGGVAHNTIHPVRGLYCIKRSGRIFYRGA